MRECQCEFEIMLRLKTEGGGRQEDGEEIRVLADRVAELRRR